MLSWRIFGELVSSLLFYQRGILETPLLSKVLTSSFCIMATGRQISCKQAGFASLKREISSPERIERQIDCCVEHFGIGIASGVNQQPAVALKSSIATTLTQQAFEGCRLTATLNNISSHAISNC
jgi:hypothetical protein